MISPAHHTQHNPGHYRWCACQDHAQYNHTKGWRHYLRCGYLRGGCFCCCCCCCRSYPPALWRWWQQIRGWYARPASATRHMGTVSWTSPLPLATPRPRTRLHVALSAPPARVTARHGLITPRTRCIWPKLMLRLVLSFSGFMTRYYPSPQCIHHFLSSPHLCCALQVHVHASNLS